MREINKVDYFCGAFLSYLISNGVEPTLFEAGEKSKIVEFTIRDSIYKVFCKYSTKKKTVTKQGKSYDTWNVGFAEKELALLENFGDNSKKVAIVCICTDEKLKNADVAVIPYEDACKCLGLMQDEINKQRVITVRHLKGSSKLLCHGTGLSQDNAIEIPHNFEKFFGLEGNEV